jgi:hypothetical protein
LNTPAIGNAIQKTARGVTSESGENKSLLRILAVCILVWAVDFKSSTSGGGAAIQGVILVTYVLAACFLALSALRRGIGAGPLWLLVAAVAIFILESSVVGLSNGQDPYAIFVNVIPPLIFASAGVITYMTLVTTQKNPGAFVNMLRYACLIFVIAHIMIILVTRGKISLSESRYEVLSAATIPALAIIPIGLMKRLSRLDIGIFSLNLVVSLVSVTRTLIFVLVLQITTVFAARPSTILKPSTLKGFSVFGASLLLVLALDLAAGTGLATRWFQRITISQTAGADPTSLTRRAEVKFMLSRFTDSTDTLLFGNGLAALTSLTGPEARQAAQMVGEASVNLHSVGFGHENYVSILFIAGLLGGGGLLVIQFLNGIQAFALLRRFDSFDLSTQEAEAHIGAWGSLIVIGALAVGFFGGSLADRDLSVWYGIGTGMLYWARGILKAPAVHTNPAPARHK